MLLLWLVVLAFTFNGALVVGLLFVGVVYTCLDLVSIDIRFLCCCLLG